jgi:murein DD-endopeptidase MepM/ murein hydrolase activator NlpD
MKYFGGKEICLWVVSPHNGRVRKFRSSSLLFYGLGAAIVASVALFALLATSYGRLQLLRVHDSLSFNQLQSTLHTVHNENEELSTQALSLRDRLAELEERLQEQTETTLGAQKYEEALKERLRQLRVIVRSASALGVAPYDKTGTIEQKVQTDTKDVGGAEVQCDSSGNCLRAISSVSGIEADVENTRMLEAELLGALDHYIATAKVAPFGMPAKGRLSSRYGFRLSPFGKGVRLHEGIDIAVPFGAAVFATGEGIVYSVRRDKTYGLVVDIRHKQGLTTRYAHLSKVLVSEGSYVKRGQTIARAGSSGRSTGPHLHYEVLVKGIAKDPLKFVQLARQLDKLLAQPLIELSES